jgi:hypothetical protein
MIYFAGHIRMSMLQQLPIVLVPRNAWHSGRHEVRGVEPVIRMPGPGEVRLLGCSEAGVVTPRCGRRYMPASACRPPSALISRSMLSVRPPAFTISGFATANPEHTILASSLTVNPCARNISSAHPCELPARISSARYRRSAWGCGALVGARSPLISVCYSRYLIWHVSPTFPGKLG